MKSSSSDTCCHCLDITYVKCKATYCAYMLLPVYLSTIGELKSRSNNKQNHSAMAKGMMTFDVMKILMIFVYRYLKDDGG